LLTGKQTRTGVTFSFFLFLFHKRALQGVMKKKKEKEEK
jgi:hypothetical protein